MNKLIIDCSTGQSVEVPLTQAEIEEIERTSRESAEKADRERIEAEERESAKISAMDKLRNLGLTETEILAITG